jgi:hypothetical protein
MGATGRPTCRWEVRRQPARHAATTRQFTCPAYVKILGSTCGCSCKQRFRQPNKGILRAMGQNLLAHFVPRCWPIPNRGCILESLWSFTVLLEFLLQPLNGVELTILEAEGTVCPGRSFTQEISQGRTAVLDTTQWRTEVGENPSPRDGGRRSCTSTIRMHFPRGCSKVTLFTEFHGAAVLELGV